MDAGRMLWPRRDGNMGITRHLSIICACVLLAAGSGQARSLVNACPEADASIAGNLVVQTPALKYTVPNFDPSWFDTDNPEKAPTLFTLMIAPALKGYAGSLRLRVQVFADTSLGRNPSAGLIGFDRLSLGLTSAEIGVPLRSNDVFGLTWEAGGTDFRNSALYDLILANRVAPEMNLVFRFNLTCEDDLPLASATSVIALGDEGRLRYVKTIQALYPGTRISNPAPVPLYTVTPIFKIVSELFNAKVFEYPPDQPRIEIFLYEMSAGGDPRDALGGLEFAKFGVGDQSPAPYPPHLPRLRPGMTYVWRARALLRGPTSDYLYSEPLYFKVDERLEGGASRPGSEVSDIRTLEQQIKYGD